MTPSEYQRLAERTECNQKASHVRFAANYPIAVRLNHAVLGLAGEVGELAGAVERWLYYGKELDRINVAEEIGDCFWYLAEACNALGLRMGSVMTANIAKLQQRYPEKFDYELAAEENRNRGEEAAVVNNSVRVQDQGDLASSSAMATTSAVELTIVKDRKEHQLMLPDMGEEKRMTIEQYKESCGHCVTESYGRMCIDCGMRPVHKDNRVGICPDCFAAQKARAQSMFGNEPSAKE